MPSSFPHRLHRDSVSQKVRYQDFVITSSNIENIFKILSLLYSLGNRTVTKYSISSPVLFRFLPRDARKSSVRLLICPSVRPSVTLRYRCNTSWVTSRDLIYCFAVHG